MKTDKQQATAATDFARRWEGKGYERGESQLFWADLLTNVYGVEDLPSFIRFEEQVKNMVDSTNFIDAHIPSTKVLIEQKSLGKDLRKGNPQSDGSILNPFQQAKKYVANMPLSQHPRWIVTCNFAEFLIYDMECPHGEPENILLKDLGKDYYRLHFLVDNKIQHLTKELQVSMRAGEIVGMIYEALTTPLLSSQGEKIDATMLHDINVLCVRLVFCLYAEDAGVFGKRNMFHDYLSQYNTKEMRRALMTLFDVLATPIEERDPFLEPDLAQFPYVNGGLFGHPSKTTARRNVIPPFTDELRKVLLQNASLDFDWSEISPTIFGAVFESTLNPETRRKGGMHYTSIENIHKVIDPLFLDDLRQELDTILEEKVERTRQRKLDRYQDKLASLTFLDPACGSGNFLTETYLSLRRLENEVIRERYHGQAFIGFEEVNPIKVSIQQFFGIEINDFAVTVATTALWISEAQMLAETEKIIRRDIDFLPLKSYANIREGNALRMDWDMMEMPSNVPTFYAKKAHIIMEDKKEWKTRESDVYEEINLVTTHYDSSLKNDTITYEVKYDYIMGNPPFVGARQMNKSQKQDLISIFGTSWKNVGNMDYVSCWYKRAYQLIKGTNTHAAFVSTNSICQGEQVTNLWKPLIEDGLCIDYAYQTFRWDSESTKKAHVHCVIIGFSNTDSGVKRIFANDQQPIIAKNINGYLLDAPNIFIKKRSKPICDAPPISLGGQPIDDGNLTLTKEEKDHLLQREPQAEAFIRPFMMGKDFIDRKPRYCIWLKGVDSTVIRKCPMVMKRIERVREFRLASKRESTLRAAEMPTLFGAPFECKGNYIAIPKVSSEKRKYIPMDYLAKEVIPGDKLFCMENASLYHFGMLMSNVHMAWMRATCGRLEIDYSYSNTIVYNNFPWPSPTETQRLRIEQTAQAILDVRADYPNASLADLYDDLTMPPELRKAHQENDRMVMAAYGFDWRTMSESQIVAELFKLYQDLTGA